jgi:Putative F0F1-ATPase subunit Ca2+/Mg2+ transporter
MAQAAEWVARITTIGLIMVLPTIGGAWLDRRWGTSFLSTAGLVLGVVAGFYQLLAITKATGSRGRRPGSAGEGNSRDVNRDKE